MTDRELMIMARDALFLANTKHWTTNQIGEAINALNARLSAPDSEWVGLTDDEIQDLGYLSEKFDASNSEWFDRWGFARAIEAKLKEKNKW